MTLEHIHKLAKYYNSAAKYFLCDYFVAKLPLDGPADLEYNKHDTRDIS